jgi:hypothetical protein
MVLQTCHTSKLERFLDSLSEGWMKPHCYFSGGDRGSERHQYTDRENVCAVRNQPACQSKAKSIPRAENGPSVDVIDVSQHSARGDRCGCLQVLPKS